MMMRPGYLQLLHDRSSHEVDAIMQCIIFIGHRVYTGVVEARARGAPAAHRAPSGARGGQGHGQGAATSAKVLYSWEGHLPSTTGSRIPRPARCQAVYCTDTPVRRSTDMRQGHNKPQPTEYRYRLPCTE
jgi:hypothetical protein